MATTAACRILVISSTVETAHQFVQRIKALSNPTEIAPHISSQVTSPSASTGALGELHASLTNSEPAVSIPWTISNKYYTADVHFELRQLQSFVGYLASEVPAVVFVWNQGEQYMTHISELSKKLEHYDPEVSLAVRFASASDRADEEEQGEDNLDEFISSHGFEYVDGERGKRVPTQDGSSFSDEEQTGVPGLPRVIDALSTIMWPSLVQTQRTTQRKSRAGDLLDWASMEDASGADGGALLQSRHATGSQIDMKSKLQNEMDELESWLQRDQASKEAKNDHNDPWSTAHGHQVDLDYYGSDHEHEHGFEDDFDDFVGAPMDVMYHGDTRRSKPPITNTNAASSPSSSAAPQRAFTTDFVTFGGEVVHVDEDDTEIDAEDPDMPSRAEIEDMSRRLFGSASLGIPPSSPAWQRLHSPVVQSTTRDLPVDDGHSSASASTGQDKELRDSGFEQLGNGDEEGDEEFEMGAFDLSKVLGALQGMKEQIANMDDEGERRKAAAKVALGLVYGLQKEGERDTELEGK